MIAWSIHAALESKVFDAVLVTTDDEEIASIAEKEGALVPFQRPSELSGDHAATMPVVSHAIEWWQTHRYQLEFASCIYATAPFIRPGILSQAIQILRNSDSDFVLSVAQFDYPVQRSLRLGGDGMLKFADPENALKRSQDLEPRYHDAGQFFAGRAEAFMRYPTTMSGKTLPIVIPRLLCQDIDTPQDWDQAAELFAYLRATGGGTYR